MTKLKRYLVGHGISPEAFAELIGRKKNCVFRGMRGERLGLTTMLAVEKQTAQELTINDMLYPFIDEPEREAV